MENVTQNRIKQLAKSNGVTVAQVLKDTGLNPGFVTDLTRKDVMPASDKLIKIADYFNVSIDFLLGRTDNPEVNK